MTSTIVYKGDLRCECKHLQSGTIIETDAPTDNRGKGEKFSPTDLLCISLATCIMTTMGIKAMDLSVDLSESGMSVTKHMISDPRRVGKIEIILNLISRNLSEKDKIILERVGNNCPVKNSLKDDIELNIKYNWQES